MKTIKGEDIDKILKNNKRIYLCGQLIKVDNFEHIENDGLEIGISRYKTFTADLPHVHTSNNEYNIVLNGEMKVYLFNEQKEYHLCKGDLFLIEPDMPYISKSIAGTEVLFVKSPGGNDKQLIPVDSSTKYWMSGWKQKMNEI